jgi:hypothetical protein
MSNAIYIYMGVVAVRGRSGVVKAKAAVGMSWQLGVGSPPLPFFFPRGVSEK